ncbi:hypothetical protein ACFFV7_51125 [Nonomuraea spiralis]|uniref:Uncharacterized protein n=1 Tax=Nonomuraea spiralis TaxID=46182 RepID=A0ABV5J0D5_9ACTN|nr:hypothetical protein [Nonomuraea spiralis]
MNLRVFFALLIGVILAALAGGLLAFAVTRAATPVPTSSPSPVSLWEA